MLVLGIDLAWKDTSAAKPGSGTDNESGVAALDCPSGKIADAGWTRGLGETLDWIEQWAMDDTLLFVDAPLVVLNADKQRRCEQAVGQRYGRWKVSANSTNLTSARLGGMKLFELLVGKGWRYDDGTSGPPTSGRVFSECYPYTILVGADELGYNVERPVYKRKPSGMSTAAFASPRATVCDDLIQRMVQLHHADPALDLQSHGVTAALVGEVSPTANAVYKHREDLIDASLCAWGAALWLHHGFDRCQVLGDDDPLVDPVAGRATIIAPARPEQRRPNPSRGPALPVPEDHPPKTGEL